MHTQDQRGHGRTRDSSVQAARTWACGVPCGTVVRRALHLPKRGVRGVHARVCPLHASGGGASWHRISVTSPLLLLAYTVMSWFAMGSMFFSVRRVKVPGAKGKGQKMCVRNRPGRGRRQGRGGTFQEPPQRFDATALPDLGAFPEVRSHVGSGHSGGGGGGGRGGGSVLGVLSVDYTVCVGSIKRHSAQQTNG